MKGINNTIEKVYLLCSHMIGRKTKKILTSLLEDIKRYCNFECIFRVSCAPEQLYYIFIKFY